MRIIFLTILVVAYAVAYPSAQDKNKRKPQATDCRGCGSLGLDGLAGGPHSGPGSNCKCDDPCDDCQRPRLTQKTYSPVTCQERSENTVLVCSTTSYFSRLEYEGSYEDNTTCNGLTIQDVDLYKGVYTGIIVKSDGTETREVLNGKNYRAVWTKNNGNANRFEETDLADCKCRGDSLRTFSSYLADDPLTGCCQSGVNHWTGTDFRLRLYGKCCSDCYLLQSAISWGTPDKN